MHEPFQPAQPQSQLNGPVPAGDRYIESSHVLWVLLSASWLCWVLGVVLPLVELIPFPLLQGQFADYEPLAAVAQRTEKSTLETLVLLHDQRYFFAFFILLICSIVVPALKLVTATLALLGETCIPKSVITMLACLSSYQLLDIFLGLLFVAFCNNEAFEAKLRIGFILYTAFCVCSQVLILTLEEKRRIAKVHPEHPNNAALSSEGARTASDATDASHMTGASAPELKLTSDWKYALLNGTVFALLTFVGSGEPMLDTAITFKAIALSRTRLGFAEIASKINHQCGILVFVLLALTVVIAPLVVVILGVSASLADRGDRLLHIASKVAPWITADVFSLSLVTFLFAVQNEHLHTTIPDGEAFGITSEWFSGFYVGLALGAAAFAIKWKVVHEEHAEYEEIYVEAQLEQASERGEVQARQPSSGTAAGGHVLDGRPIASGSRQSSHWRSGLPFLDQGSHYEAVATTEDGASQAAGPEMPSPAPSQVSSIDESSAGRPWPSRADSLTTIMSSLPEEHAGQAAESEQLLRSQDAGKNESPPTPSANTEINLQDVAAAHQHEETPQKGAHMQDALHNLLPEDMSTQAQVPQTLDTVEADSSTPAGAEPVVVLEAEAGEKLEASAAAADSELAGGERLETGVAEADSEIAIAIGAQLDVDEAVADSDTKVAEPMPTGAAVADFVAEPMESVEAVPESNTGAAEPMESVAAVVESNFEAARLDLEAGSVGGAQQVPSPLQGSERDALEAALEAEVSTTDAVAKLVEPAEVAEDRIEGMPASSSGVEAVRVDVGSSSDGHQITQASAETTEKEEDRELPVKEAGEVVTEGMHGMQPPLNHELESGRGSSLDTSVDHSTGQPDSAGGRPRQQSGAMRKVLRNPVFHVKAASWIIWGVCYFCVKGPEQLSYMKVNRALVVVLPLINNVLHQTLPATVGNCDDSVRPPLPCVGNQIAYRSPHTSTGSEVLARWVTGLNTVHLRSASVTIIPESRRPIQVSIAGQVADLKISLRIKECLLQVCKTLWDGTGGCCEPNRNFMMVIATDCVHNALGAAQLGDFKLEYFDIDKIQLSENILGFEQDLADLTPTVRKHVQGLTSSIFNGTTLFLNLTFSEMVSRIWRYNVPGGLRCRDLLKLAGGEQFAGSD